MSFGDQTVTFVTVAESGTPGWGGLKTKTRTETPVAGCQFWAVGVTESPDGITNVSEGRYRCIAPDAAAALAVKPNDELKVDGVTYQVEGPPLVRYDGAAVSHVTIMCKRQVG